MKIDSQELTEKLISNLERIIACESKVSTDPVKHSHKIVALWNFELPRTLNDLAEKLNLINRKIYLKQNLSVHIFLDTTKQKVDEVIESMNNIVIGNLKELGSNRTIKESLFADLRKISDLAHEIELNSK